MWLCCQDLRAKYVLNPVLLMCFLPELKQLLALCVGHKKKKKKKHHQKKTSVDLSRLFCRQSCP